jgi:glycosyltransferase involved in cell wall biosynthesis
MKLETHPIMTHSNSAAALASAQTRALPSSSSSANSSNGTVRMSGRLIVNADDWGRDQATTDRIFECTELRTVSAVSAMMFMDDSERAAAIARKSGIDAGLHLNFTEPFSVLNCPELLLERQRELSRHLLRHPMARIFYYSSLADSFKYVVDAQLDEYRRLYGQDPQRIDGHHHLHLCTNVLLDELLPEGTLARRNFSFLPGEKSLVNRLYRKMIDRRLARRHRLVDGLYNLSPLEPAGRLRRIFSLARNSVVELEAHPANPEEYQFLTSGGMLRLLGDLTISPDFTTPDFTTPVGPPSVADANDEVKHISVCICTYKRPDFLKRLLQALNTQETGGLFTYSIVVADNDQLQSGKGVVEEFGKSSAVPNSISIRYCVEPRQNIALARNKAIENAEGDFVAFIDDDEFPAENWLLNLFCTCERYQVDGVLGPVRRHFDQTPPEWIVKGDFYERPIHPTGLPVRWSMGRTGNVLLRGKVFTPGEPPFRPEFRHGEDQDFFRRRIEDGYRFVWCSDAIAYEVVPPVRWKRTFMLKKALLRGSSAALHPTLGAEDIWRSIIAVPAYALALPFALILGQHRFMKLLISLCDHLGKLLTLAGINPIREQYVTE